MFDLLEQQAFLPKGKDSLNRICIPNKNPKKENF